jgi:hypothetical protein
MSVGYSGTPLWKKLGLKDGMTACAIGAPENYAALLGENGPAPMWQNTPIQDISFLHHFTTERTDLETALARYLGLMARDGMIWISWRKKASKVPTDVTEDTIRELCLPIGLVDIKVCAVSEIWSGLKLVIRKELR